VRGVDEGKAQIGIGNSSTTVDGLEGRAPYPKKVTKVCQLANLSLVSEQEKEGTTASRAGQA